MCEKCAVKADVGDTGDSSGAPGEGKNANKNRNLLKKRRAAKNFLRIRLTDSPVSHRRQKTGDEHQGRKPLVREVTKIGACYC
jgi:hypothetical protein